MAIPAEPQRSQSLKHLYQSNRQKWSHCCFNCCVLFIYLLAKLSISLHIHYYYTLILLHANLHMSMTSVHIMSVQSGLRVKVHFWTYRLWGQLWSMNPVWWTCAKQGAKMPRPRGQATLPVCPSISGINSGYQKRTASLDGTALTQVHCGSGQKTHICQISIYSKTLAMSCFSIQLYFFFTSIIHEQSSTFPLCWLQVCPKFTSERAVLRF